MTSEKQSTTISISSDLLEAAKAEAKRQRRTLSAQLEHWIDERLSETGSDLPQPQKQPA